MGDPDPVWSTVFKIDFFDFKIKQIVDIAIPYFIAAFFLSNPAFIESSIKLFFSARDRRFLDGIVILTETQQMKKSIKKVITY